MRDSALDESFSLPTHPTSCALFVGLDIRFGPAPSFRNPSTLNDQRPKRAR